MQQLASLNMYTPIFSAWEQSRGKAIVLSWLSELVGPKPVLGGPVNWFVAVVDHVVPLPWLPMLRYPQHIQSSHCCSRPSGYTESFCVESPLISPPVPMAARPLCTSISVPWSGLTNKNWISISFLFIFCTKPVQAQWVSWNCNNMPAVATQTNVRIHFL